MGQRSSNKSDDFLPPAADFVHLARLALSGRHQDIHLHIRQVAKRERARNAAFADALTALLRESPTRTSPLRDAGPAMPVDLDSRLQLMRVERVQTLEVVPVFEPRVLSTLNQIVGERSDRKLLELAGLDPTRSALFVGQPGVGKSLAARWLAWRLDVPLLILDLAAVMSSFLGRTGNNLRYVLDYAKSTPCILFLDELDAIAKRRDDTSEVGELKRLVTVLLQEIDDWPSSGLLIAATNHPDLLDPAVWRRFDVVLDFSMPNPAAVRTAVKNFLGPLATARPSWANILAITLQGLSFSDIERVILRVRRAFALSKENGDGSFEELLASRIDALSKDQRGLLAVQLVSSGAASQRRAYELTGVSRDTIRSLMREGRAGRLREEASNG